MIADTSGLLAFFNARDRHHAAAAQAVRSARSPLVVSPLVVAELDHLVLTRLGSSAELSVLDELSGGAYELAEQTAADLVDAARLVRKYADQQIGATDAHLVVLARRYGTRQLLSLDHRHFDVVRPLQGGRFSLLP